MHPFTPRNPCAATEPRRYHDDSEASEGPCRAVERSPRRSSPSRATHIPRHRLRETELSPDVAYQIIHDELMLDGNARMNLATFVTTWMEPQAEKLMAECLDKNMIDKDEYPQTAELEMRCVNILSRLWNAPDAGRRWAARRPAPARRRCWAAWPSSAAGRQRRTADGLVDRQAEPRDGDQRPGLLGEVRRTTGTSRCGSCRWRATGSTSPPRRP